MAHETQSVCECTTPTNALWCSRVHSTSTIMLGVLPVGCPQGQSSRSCSTQPCVPHSEAVSAAALLGSHSALQLSVQYSGLPGAMALHSLMHAARHFWSAAARACGPHPQIRAASASDTRARRWAACVGAVRALGAVTGAAAATIGRCTRERTLQLWVRGAGVSSIARDERLVSRKMM